MEQLDKTAKIASLEQRNRNEESENKLERETTRSLPRSLFRCDQNQDNAQTQFRFFELIKKKATTKIAFVRLTTGLLKHTTFKQYSKG